MDDRTRLNSTVHFTGLDLGTLAHVRWFCTILNGWCRHRGKKNNSSCNNNAILCYPIGHDYTYGIHAISSCSLWFHGLQCSEHFCAVVHQRYVHELICFSFSLGSVWQWWDFSFPQKFNFAKGTEKQFQPRTKDIYAELKMIRLLLLLLLFLYEKSTCQIKVLLAKDLEFFQDINGN